MRPIQDRNYLPIMLNLSGKEVLIVGGGVAGLQKARAIIPFNLKLRVISPNFHPDFKKLYVEIVHLNILDFVERAWRQDDLSPDIGLVYACTDSAKTNSGVIHTARQLGILCCDAGNPAEGDFISPACTQNNGFIMAISSGGQSAKSAAAVRNALIEPFIRASLRAAQFPISPGRDKM